MKFCLTITERAPTEDGTETNTYHVLCDDMDEVASRLVGFWLSFGILVSATVTPWDSWEE